MSVSLPPSFDSEIYCCEAGISMTPENAWLHYCSHGKQLGIVCSAIRGEKDFLNILYKQDAGTILEIGPGANPRMKGDNVKYYDVRDSAQTVEWAKKHHYSTEKAPHTIHYVSKEADMSIVKQKFDLVFSSHNIEHQIDIIDHIIHIERILVTDGLFACIVPNKKYTFDHYRTESTIFEIINEHIERKHRKQHSFLKYSNHKLSSTHNDTKAHWEGIHGEQKTVATERIRQCLASYFYSDFYKDIHSWIFSEDSFETIFMNLFFLNITDLKLERIYRTLKNSNSFFAIFKKVTTPERLQKRQTLRGGGGIAAC